ncbi:uncharacterized protein LOC108864009 [Galendromus occidentalis]|uniref:Uncharacterized protein LOC108864009 n=1 Tax=Galendromus occidentalis TaxID=34638 RepID=A0AAJ7P9E3_9ACAR|nr:uncharacterized protein LOC108864009 [Galendromus occidentalis]
MASNITKTQKGREKLIHEGWMYVRDRVIGGGSVQSWRCMYKNASCPCRARAYTSIESGEVVSTKGSHTDPVDPSEVETTKVREAIKRRCEETSEPPSSVMSSAFLTASRATLGRLPERSVVARIINRHRSAVSNTPAFESRSSIVIPEHYREYEFEPGRFENFVVADSGVGDVDRIIIFGRESTREWIGLVQKLFVDGTLSLSPPTFSQIFVVLAERSQCVLPVAYALLPNKTAETYTRALSLLKNAWPALSPLAVVMDFERAVMNAVRSVFSSDTRMDGCFFHLVKNIKLKLAGEGLMSRYSNDDDFALNARMIAALAFVPPAELNNAISELAALLPPELVTVLNYFEDRTLDGEARTNNYAEAAHRRMQLEFGVSHPTLWKFIEGLRRIQNNRDFQLEQFLGGAPSSKKRDKYVEADRRILEIVRDVSNRTHVEYLRGIAHNFFMES